MNSSRKQLFSRPGFAQKQDIDIGYCELQGRIHRLTKGFAHANQPGGRTWFRPSHDEKAFNRGQEALVVEWLTHKVRGTQLHRLDRGLDVAKGSQHDHGNTGRFRLQTPESLHSVNAVQVKVEKDKIRSLLIYRLEGGFSRRQAPRTVSLFVEQGGNEGAEIALVVNDQDAGHLPPLCVGR